MPKGTNILFKNNEIFSTKKQRPSAQEEQPQREKSNTVPNNIKKSGNAQANANLIFMDDGQPGQVRQERGERGDNSERGNHNFSIPENINFGKISDTLKDEAVKQPQERGKHYTSNTNDNSTRTNNASKTPIPEKKTSQNIGGDDWGSLFQYNDDKSKQAPDKQIPAEKPKIDLNLEGVFSGIPLQTSHNWNKNHNTIQIHDWTGANTKPIDKISPSLSEEEIKNEVDKVIGVWVMSVNNERKNWWYLLSSLDQVWSNDPSWGEVSMQDLVTNKSSVRTFYKKAMRQLHADKNRDKDYKTRYIADCWYQLLNEANASYTD